jgi:hypothetical protein
MKALKWCKQQLSLEVIDTARVGKLVVQSADQRAGISVRKAKEEKRKAIKI